MEKTSKSMTKEQKTAFIKDNLAPVFTGMNAKDVVEILTDTMALMKNIFSEFTCLPKNL